MSVWMDWEVGWRRSPFRIQMSRGWLELGVVVRTQDPLAVLQSAS